MGRIRAPFGVKGWIKIQPYTERTDSLLAYPRWWLEGNSGWQAHAVAEAAVHGNSVVARLEGCIDRDAAAQLKGRSVAIPREQMPAPAPGEFYWADLIGLEVINMRGEALGLVEGLLDTGAGVVLTLDDGVRRLLPFAETVVRQIDCEAGRIVVDWDKDY
ncbi:MAG: ribosome maturation factor RimM [Burkholderiales bacterium]